jgi:hypothetical protein
LAGSVEPSVVAVVNGAMNAVGVAGAVLELAAATVLDVVAELDVLLELPQPARTSAAAVSAASESLGTGVSPVG